jgi:aspartate aminotransferase-like enzyme
MFDFAITMAPAARIEQTTSSSFACDLKKWLQIMETFEQGGHAYHATMPTVGLRTLRGVMRETLSFGQERARAGLLDLGGRVRALLERHGFASVAAPGFQAPGVIVSYTDDDALKNGSRFAAQGIQIAAGVPLMCDEPADFRSFRIGLFGLDKLADADRTVRTLERALTALQ